MRTVPGYLVRALLAVSCAGASASAGSATITVATFLVDSLALASRSVEDLESIADVVARFDVVAVQDVREPAVMLALQERLAARAEHFEVLVSRTVDDTGERHAFLWRVDRVALVDSGGVYYDGGPPSVRPVPYASFRSAEFDFTLISIHVPLALSGGPRREMVHAAELAYQHVQDMDPLEQDVLLLGSFGFTPTEVRAPSYGWESLQDLTPVLDEPEGTLISGAGPYDNLWLDPAHVIEYAGSSGVDAFDETLFGNDDAAAAAAVSRHRPAWAVFRTNARLDDDITPRLRPDSHAWAFAGDTVLIDAGKVHVPGDLYSYAWRQVHGVPVDLSDARDPRPWFVAPAAVDTLAFEVALRSGDMVERDTLAVGVRPVDFGFPVSPGRTARWERVYAPGVTVNAVAVAPTDPSVVYAGTWLGVSRSRDAGTTWEVADAGMVRPPEYPQGMEVIALAVDPAAADHVYAASRVTGYETNDGGTQWHHSGASAGDLQFAHGVLYAAGGEDLGPFVLQPDGERIDLNGNLPRNDYGGRGGTRSIAPDPFDPELVAAVASNGWYPSLYRMMGTARWSSVHPPDGWCRIVEASPHTGWLYVGGAPADGHGAWRSRRLGEGWEPLAPELGAAGGPYQYLMDPAEPLTVYAAASTGVFCSRDGGDSWALLPGLPDGEVPQALSITSTEPRWMYVGTSVTGTGSGEGPGDGHVYRVELRRVDATAVAGPAPGPRFGALRLSPAWPNPFNSTVHLRYVLGVASPVRVEVYNASGQRICRLLAAVQAAGAHQIAWDGTDGGGAEVASGVYHFCLSVGGLHRVQPVLLLR